MDHRFPLPFHSTDITFAYYINGIFHILRKGHNSVSNEIQSPAKLFQDITAHFPNSFEGSFQQYEFQRADVSLGVSHELNWGESTPDFFGHWSDGQAT